MTLLAALTGVLLGLCAYTFGYAKGSSYFTNDPRACANCHVMRDQYDSWRKSSHHSAAGCNDCHTPPGGLIPKYWTKMQNGFFHSLAFTTGWFPDEIRITARNHSIANRSCAKCHEEITHQISQVRQQREGVPCIQCHNQAGHQ